MTYVWETAGKVSLGFFHAEGARLGGKRQGRQARQPANWFVAADVLDGNRRCEGQRASFANQVRFSSSTKRAVSAPKPRSRTGALARTFCISVTVSPSKAWMRLPCAFGSRSSVALGL